MNSKILILFAVVLVVGLATVNAGPVYMEEDHELKYPYPEEENHPGPRQKRVTCDLLSASFKGSSINDSACAAHCLIQGFKGGHCSNGVCRCRR